MPLINLFIEFWNNNTYDNLLCTTGYALVHSQTCQWLRLLLHWQWPLLLKLPQMGQPLLGVWRLQQAGQRPLKGRLCRALCPGRAGALSHMGKATGQPLTQSVHFRLKCLAAGSICFFSRLVQPASSMAILAVMSSAIFGRLLRSGAPEYFPIGRQTSLLHCH